MPFHIYLPVNLVSSLKCARNARILSEKLCLKNFSPPHIATVPLKCKLPLLVSFLARRVSFLARRVSFPARRVSFLARRFSFLSRITEAFSMEYITRKKPIIYVASQFSIPTCKGRYQSDGTERRDDKKDTSRQLLAGLKIISPDISGSIWQNWMIQTLK